MNLYKASAKITDMSNLEDAVNLLGRLRPMIMDDQIQVTDEPEVAEVAVIGGRSSRKTGNRVLTLRVPYSVSETYIQQQIGYAATRKEELRLEAEVIDAAIARLTEELAALKRPKTS